MNFLPIPTNFRVFWILLFWPLASHAFLFDREPWWQKYSLLPEVKTTIPDRMEDYPVTTPPEPYRKNFGKLFWMDSDRILGTFAPDQRWGPFTMMVWNTRTGEMKEYGSGPSFIPRCYSREDGRVVIGQGRDKPSLVGILGGPYEEVEGLSTGSGRMRSEKFPYVDTYTCKVLPPQKEDRKPNPRMAIWQLRTEDGWIADIDKMSLRQFEKWSEFGIRQGEDGYIQYFRSDGTEVLRYGYAATHYKLPPLTGMVADKQGTPMERARFFLSDINYLPWSGKYHLPNGLSLQNQMEGEEIRSVHILDPVQGRMERYPVPPEIWRWARAMSIGGDVFRNGVLWNVSYIDDKEKPGDRRYVGGTFLQRPNGELFRISQWGLFGVSPNGCRMMVSKMGGGGVIELCKGDE